MSRLYIIVLGLCSISISILYAVTYTELKLTMLTAVPLNIMFLSAVARYKKETKI